MEEHFVPRLNNLFTTSPFPNVTIEKERSTSLAEMPDRRGVYSFDFRLRFSQLRTSLPMRFSADTRRPGLAVMGVRGNLRQGARPSARFGEWNNQIIMRGGSVTCWTDLTVAPTGRSARVTHTRPRRSLVVVEEDGLQWIRCTFSFVHTANAFMLFTQRGGEIKNIISLMQMEERGYTGRFTWYTNGWSSDQAANLREGARWDRVHTRLNANLAVVPYTVARGQQRLENLQIFEATGVNLSIAPHTRIGQVHSDTFRGLNIDTMESDFSRHFAGIMNTTPAGLRRVTEICGRRLELLANRPSPVYRTISHIVNNTLTRELIARMGWNTNLTFHRGNLIGRILSDSHFRHNSGFTFSGAILNQHAAPAGDMKMGFVLPGSSKSANACGWVAPYNMFYAMERPIPRPAEIIRFIERNNGLLADGRLGVNPRIYGRLFQSFGGIRTRLIMTNRNLDSLARHAGIGILCYWNPFGFTSGAHYITIHWDPETQRYTGYNTGGRPRQFSSIDTFIRDNTGGFIALLVRHF